jgi:hypothetical protein
MIGLGLHAVPNVFHRVKIVAWGILLRRAGLELRIFINKRRIRRLERRMLAFQRLRLIAEKCKDRFDVVEGALIRDEIIEIVELLGKTHGLGLSAKRAESGTGNYWTKCRKALADVIAKSEPETETSGHVSRATLIGPNTPRLYMTFIV